MAPEPNRERSLRVSSTLVGLELGLPAPWTSPRTRRCRHGSTSNGRRPAGRRGGCRLDPWWAAPMRSQSDAGGMRLAHLTLNFGTGEAAPSDAQILNVGGSVARLDLAGWLKLSPAGQSARPLSDYLRTARFNVAELDYLGLAFRDVSLDLAVAEGGGLRVAVGGPNVAGTSSCAGAPILPSRGSCNSSGCILTRRRTPSRRMAARRTTVRRAAVQRRRAIRAASRQSIFMPRS